MTMARLGARNDVHCVSIEHKLGIHASPTCVMAFGDNGGAIGYLVGEENEGLEVHVHHDERGALRRRPGGRGASPSAPTRQALDYARERVQGRDIGVRGGAG